MIFLIIYLIGLAILFTATIFLRRHEESGGYRWDTETKAALIVCCFAWPVAIPAFIPVGLVHVVIILHDKLSAK